MVETTARPEPIIAKKKSMRATISVALMKVCRTVPKSDGSGHQLAAGCSRWLQARTKILTGGVINTSAHLRKKTSVVREEFASSDFDSRTRQ